MQKTKNNILDGAFPETSHQIKYIVVMSFGNTDNNKKCQLPCMMRGSSGNRPVPVGYRPAPSSILFGRVLSDAVGASLVYRADQRIMSCVTEHIIIMPRSAAARRPQCSTESTEIKSICIFAGVLLHVLRLRQCSGLRSNLYRCANDKWPLCVLGYYFFFLFLLGSPARVRVVCNSHAHARMCWMGQIVRSN